MKFVYGAVFATVMAVSGCSTMSTLLPSSDKTPQTLQGQLNSCMLTEADSRMRAGTLFTSGIPDAARSIASSCIRKLSLQSEGLDTQAIISATNILNSLNAVR